MGIQLAKLPPRSRGRAVASAFALASAVVAACSATPPGHALTAGLPLVAIYEVKDGTYPVGAQVALRDVLVTAPGPGGFFVQVREDEPGYAGRDFSGLWVACASCAVSPGDRVRIDWAQVQDLAGERIVGIMRAVVTAAGERLPSPEIVAPVAVATGGVQAAALEGVLVRVDGASVVGVDSSGGFVVAGGLRVGDLLWAPTPAPAAGDTYAWLEGVLSFRQGDSQLLPRRAGDLAFPPALAGLGPSSFAWVGQVDGSTVPAPLTVSLALAAETDTFVAVTTASLALSIPGGGVTVPAGSLSAVVPVTGLSAGVADLTASLNGATRSSTVQVLDASAPRSVAAIAPVSAAIDPGASDPLTVTLDLPAGPGGAEVTLAVDPAAAGTVPPSVFIPEGELSASFTFVAGSTPAAASVTATLGAVSKSAAIAVMREGLVLNEIDYDQPGSPDTGEFVELFNAGPDPVSLGSLVLVFVDGALAPPGDVGRVDLSAAGSLSPGGYLVIGAPGVLAATPAGVPVLALTPSQDAIPNGGTFSGSDRGAGAIVMNDWSGQVIDTVSWHGAVLNAQIFVSGAPACSGWFCHRESFIEIVDLVEGTALPATVIDSDAAPASLCRFLNGVDTEDSAADWRVCSQPTPGAPNAP